MIKLAEENIPEKKKIEPFTKLFKSIKGAAFAADPLSGVFTALELIEPILKPLEIILEIIGALFTQLAVAALPPILETLQPIFDLLVELSPLFIELGVLVGDIIATALEPLILIFMMFMPVIKAVLPIFIQIIRIGLIPLTIILQVLSAILTPLVPLFDALAKVMAPLTPILEMLGHLVGVVFYNSIRGIALGIAVLTDLLTAGLAGAVDRVNRILPPTLFQEGGIATRPVMGVVAEAGPEAVIPLSKLSGMFDGLERSQEEMISLLGKIYEDKKFRHDLRRGF
ncbi:MAG: hypothetical protein ACFFG0_30825 [Candidatus Thorarchaeota archaeon]